MSMLEQVVRLDMKPQKNPPHVDCTQYDSGSDGWLIRAYLFNNGSAFVIPSGYTAKIEGTTKENTGFTFAATGIDNANGVVTFNLTEDATAFKGSAWCKIVFEKGTSRIAASGFWLDNDRAGVEAETVIGAPGFEEQIQDAVDAWLDEHGGGSGLTDEIKTALMDVASHIGAWTDGHGSDYVQALYDALYPPAPPATLLSISAAFNQGSAVIYDTDTLDTLKQYLVVTATYDDQTTQTVTGYTLSGTLAEGTSTITVSYGGKTATFSVAVTHASAPSTLTFSSFTPVATDERSKFYEGETASGTVSEPQAYAKVLVSNETYDQGKTVTGTVTVSGGNVWALFYVGYTDSTTMPVIAFKRIRVGVDSSQTSGSWNFSFELPAGKRLAISPYQGTEWTVEATAS